MVYIILNRAPDDCYIHTDWSNGPYTGVQPHCSGTVLHEHKEEKEIKVRAGH